jgi:two-component system response regulator WspF
MRIAVVNDVKAIIEILKRIITLNPEHEIAWTAGDGSQAVTKCAEDTPDLILMDLIMPVMDGIEATRRIMSESPCAILIVTASVAGNAGKVFEAMGAGALDAINTPSLSQSENVEALNKKLGTIGKLISKNKKSARQKDDSPLIPKDLPLVVIGSSTGGPSALADILSRLPQDFYAGIVVVQHVDSGFARGLADWLDEQAVLKVRLASAGDRPTPGEVLLAGTSDHLILKSNGYLGYTPDPRDYVYRPSVDVFFESALKSWPNQVVGVLLTGMGRDGAAGLLSLRRRGMHTIAQNMDTCAVYGMPKAAVELGAATEVLAIDAIAEALINVVRRRTNQ